MVELHNRYFFILLPIYITYILLTSTTFFIFTTTLSIFSSTTGCLIPDDLNVFNSIGYRGYKICYKIKVENTFSYTMIYIIVIYLFVASISKLFFVALFIRHAEKSNLMNFKKEKIPFISLILYTLLFNVNLISAAFSFSKNIGTKTTMDVLLCSTPLNDNLNDIQFSPSLKWFQSTTDYSLDQLIDKFQLDKVSFLHFANSTSTNDCGLNGKFNPVETKLSISLILVFLMFIFIVSAVAMSMFMIGSSKNSRKRFLMNCLIKHDVTIVESNKEMFNDFVLNNFNHDEIFLLRFMEEVLGDTDLINELWDTYKNSRIVVVIADPLPEINGLNSPAAEAA